MKINPEALAMPCQIQLPFIHLDMSMMPTHTTITSITEVLHLVTYVWPFLTSVKEKVTAYTVLALILLLGWFI